MSDVGPRHRRVEGRVSARQPASFNQDDWTKDPRKRGRLGKCARFKPPDDYSV
jgi:hypothetical protein